MLHPCSSMGRSHFELFYDLLFEERDSSELSSEYCMTNEIYGPCIYSHNLIWSYCCCQLFSGIATTTLLLVKRGETSCCVKLFVVVRKFESTESGWWWKIVHYPFECECSIICLYVYYLRTQNDSLLKFLSGYESMKLFLWLRDWVSFHCDTVRMEWLLVSYVSCQ